MSTKLPPAVKTLESALLMLRRHGIRIQTLTMAGITADGIADTRMESPKGEKPEPQKSDWDMRMEAFLNKPAAPVDLVPSESMTDD